MELRLTYKNAVFHVMQRGAGDNNIFIEIDDRNYFFYLLREVQKEFKFILYAYCLMENHLHLLIKDTEANLSDSLKILFQRYAQFFNLKYKRKGHLFGQRFEAKLCLEDSYLLPLSRYIHLNPVKANIVTDPKDYPWSSFCYYIFKSPAQPIFLDTTFIPNLFSENLESACQAYKKYVYDGIGEGASNYPKTFYGTIGAPQELLKLGLNIPPEIKKLVEITMFSNREDIKSKFEQIKGWKEIKSGEAKKYLVDYLYKQGIEIKEISEILDCHFSTVFRMLHK